MRAPKATTVLLMLMLMLVLCFAAGCRGEACRARDPAEGVPRVSSDRLQQAFFETALSTCEEIRSRAGRGEDVSEECATARALLLRDLQGLKQAPVKDVLDELERLCPGPSSKKS